MTNPTMLYRPGLTENPECWGEKIDNCIVEAEDVEAALADGWYRHPTEFRTDPEPVTFPLLDGGVPAVVAGLGALSPEELKAHLDAENAGKARKSVTTAIEAALKPPESP